MKLIVFTTTISLALKCALAQTHHDPNGCDPLSYGAVKTAEHEKTFCVCRDGFRVKQDAAGNSLSGWYDRYLYETRRNPDFKCVPDLEYLDSYLTRRCSAENRKCGCNGTVLYGQEGSALDLVQRNVFWAQPMDGLIQCEKKSFPGQPIDQHQPILGGSAPPNKQCICVSKTRCDQESTQNGHDCVCRQGFWVEGDHSLRYRLRDAGKAGYQCVLGTPAPTPNPTPSPTSPPTDSPTMSPTEMPTESPTPSPTESPTESPTATPTPAPTKPPTNSPTPNPTELPTPPTPSPTDSPTSSREHYVTITSGTCRGNSLSMIRDEHSCRRAADYFTAQKRMRGENGPACHFRGSLKMSNRQQGCHVEGPHCEGGARLNLDFNMHECSPTHPCLCKFFIFESQD